MADTLFDGSEAACGFQLYASVSGSVIADVAVGIDGAGVQIRTEDLFAVYCGGKGILALAIHWAIQKGWLPSLDATVGEILVGKCHPDVARTTLRSVLNHTAGMSTVGGIQSLAMSDVRRKEAARNQQPEKLNPDESAYSESLAWVLLGLCLESATGMAWRSAAALAANQVGVDGVQFADAPPPEQRLNVELDNSRGPAPLLLERMPTFLRSYNPGLTGLGSARRLGALAEAVIAAADPATAALLVDVSSGTLVRRDRVLNRPVTFASGFQTNLTQGDFGVGVSPRSFGHSALFGTNWMCCDLDKRLVVAYVNCGVTATALSVFLRRRSLMTQIVNACS